MATTVKNTPPRAVRPAATREEAYQAAIHAFGDVAGALGELRELDDLLHLIARHICELAGVHRCSVYLREEDSDIFRGQVGHADMDIDARVKRLKAGVPGDEFTGEIVRTKAPVVLQDARTDPRPIKSTMRNWNIRSMMGVPMVLRGDVIGLVFLDDEDRLHAFSPVDQDIAAAFADLAAVAINQAQLTGKLRSSLETVARQNQLLRRAATIEDRLTKLVLEGGDISEIAASVATLTAKPCAVYDAKGERIALEMPPGLEETIVPKLLEPQFRDTAAVRDALAALDASRGGVVEPLPSVGLNHRFMVAPVAVRDDIWGRVVLMEYQSRFGALDMHVCRRAATNIAVEMSAERRAATAEWNARASLAAEMIRGGSDPASLRRRADYLGVRLDAPRVLCLIRAAGGESVELPDPRTAAVRFVDAGAPAALATSFAKGLVVIVDLDTGKPTPAAVRDVKDLIVSVFGPGSTLAAVSTVCTSLADYERAYTQAGQVLACLERFGSRRRVLSADDLGAGRLLLATSNPAEVERFADDTLGPLLDGSDGSGDLLATLDVFFEHGRSIRRAAAALDVHENTIRYRLGRVESALGLAVGTDADAQLTVQLALLVLRLQGRIADPGETDNE